MNLLSSFCCIAIHKKVPNFFPGQNPILPDGVNEENEGHHHSQFLGDMAYLLPEYTIIQRAWVIKEQKSNDWYPYQADPCKDQGTGPPTSAQSVQADPNEDTEDSKIDVDMAAHHGNDHFDQRRDPSQNEEDRNHPERKGKVSS